jgi:hypothetical protein
MKWKWKWNRRRRLEVLFSSSSTDYQERSMSDDTVGEAILLRDLEAPLGCVMRSSNSMALRI